MTSTELYDYLPKEQPQGWLQASYVTATHYLAHHLFNTPNEFSDLFRLHLGLKDDTVDVVRAATAHTRRLEVSPEHGGSREDRNALIGAARREVLMEMDSKIKKWVGIADKQPKDGPVRITKSIRPIPREVLEETLWRLGMQPGDLPAKGWIARTQYHRAEKRWREGPGELPTTFAQALPPGKKIHAKVLRERLLGELRKNPELADLTEEEFVGVWLLLRLNPPYAGARKRNLANLTEDQIKRRDRDVKLQRIRILTQLFAAREERAKRMLRAALEGEI